MQDTPARFPLSTRRVIVAVLGSLALLWALLLPSHVLGSDVRRGNDVTIRANETIEEELYIVGSEVRFDGNARRDVLIAAGSYDQSGSIGGSLSIAAGEGTIAGSIDGSLRIAGGDVTIRSNIGGDVLILGGSVSIESQSRIGGSVILAGGQVTIRGDVADDIRGFVGDVALGGEVGGDVDLTAGDVSLESGAVISGSFRYVSSRNAEIDGRARVVGPTDHVDTVPWQGLTEDAGPLSLLARTLRSLLTGAAIVLLLPVVARSWVANGRRPLVAALVGLVAIVVLPVLAIIALVSSIGAGIGWIVALFVLAALYLSQVAAGIALGQWAMPKRWADGSRGFSLLAMTAGVLVLVGIRLVPVPWLGSIVAVLVTIFGFGVVCLSMARLTRTVPDAMA